MGRTAVVTGGASGMGLATSHHLAGRGDRVGVIDLDGAGAQATAKQLTDKGFTAVACAADVADRQAVEQAIEQVRSELGPVEILVTCAGIARFEAHTEISPASWNELVAVLLTGTFNCIQAAVPDMVAGGWGRIVTISSLGAEIGAARMAHYSAAKGGVISLTRSVAREYGPSGVTANSISPGSIDTPMARKAEADGDISLSGPGVAAIPVGRIGTADEIAAVAAFLASEEAGYVTGQIIGVNGGAYM
jgi:2-hydroxycyclohexanecarboxyl-CoA dehydrogenase